MSYVHISGWVQVTQPNGPEGPVDPGFGGGRPQPPDPGFGHPGWAPGLPGHDLPTPPPGHIWGALIRWLQRPEIGGGPAKPPGLRPVLPPSIDNGLPPNGGAPPHPWLPGSWQPIDPGFGKPPLWGFILGPDNGLPMPPGLPPVVGGGLPTPPGLPPVVGGGPSTPPGLHPGGGPITPPVHPGGGPIKPPGGAWVPTDPGFGMPIRPCPPITGKPHPPIWAWIPDRPDNTLPPEGSGGGTTTTFYPSNTVTVLAAGGSGSVNVTVEPAGPWAVDPTSVPAGVTINPMTGDMSVNLTYSVTPNTTGVAKQAKVKVNEATLTINQGAV